MQFPVKRRAPLFGVNNLPAFREPPAKVLVATTTDKLEKVAIAHQGTIECIVLQEDLVRGLFVVESEVVVRRTLVFGLWTLNLVLVAQPQQTAFNLGHSFDFS